MQCALERQIVGAVLHAGDESRKLFEQRFHKIGMKRDAAHARKVVEHDSAVRRSRAVENSVEKPEDPRVGNVAIVRNRQRGVGTIFGVKGGEGRGIDAAQRRASRYRGAPSTVNATISCCSRWLVQNRWPSYASDRALNGTRATSSDFTWPLRAS